MNFLSITNEELNSLDLKSQGNKIVSQEYRNYYFSNSGQEHYRLLTYISNNNDNIKLLDIGTLKGCSALALSSNYKNKVFSFNLVNQLDLNEIPSNIEFIIDNIMKTDYKNLLLESKFIMLDTFHDGELEKEFYEYLKFIKFKGYLLLDDIYLNNNMEKFWNSIDNPKDDLTKIGHSTGTGIVYFE